MTRPAPPSPSDVSRVVAALRAANGRAVSRRDLCERTGLCDRAVRESIAAAATSGLPIVSNGRLGGYRYAPEARDRELRALRSRIARLSERARGLERGEAGQQSEMFG